MGYGDTASIIQVVKKTRWDKPEEKKNTRLFFITM